MIEKRWIKIRTRQRGLIRIQAWCLGDFNCHLSVQDCRCYTIGHTPSGYSICEYTSFPVAIRFMRECHACYTDDFRQLGATAEDITKRSSALIERIIPLKLRSLHVTFVPRKGDIEKIRQHAPWWFDMKHSDIVLED